MIVDEGDSCGKLTALFTLGKFSQFAEMHMLRALHRVMRQAVTSLSSIALPKVRQSEPRRSRLLLAEALESRTVLSGTAMIDTSNLSFTEGTATETQALVVKVTYHGETTPFTVDYETYNITAVAGSDYVGVSGTLQFSGANGEERTFVVNVARDSVVELDESFGLRLLNPSVAGISVTEAATVAVYNDDTASLEIKLGPGYSALPGPPAEDGVHNELTDVGTQMRYRIEMTGTVDVPVEVEWGIYHGSTEVADFTGPLSGTLTLQPGGTPYVIVLLSVANDNLVEVPELFDVEIVDWSAQGREYSIGVSDAFESGTINSDDLFAVDVLDYVHAEGTDETARTNFNLTVRLERPVEGGVDVTLNAVRYTATQGVDFASAYGVVHFDEGELEKTFTVEVFADQAREADEKFQVQITHYESSAGFALQTGGRYSNGLPWALVEINNDDEGIYSASAGTRRVAFYHGSDASPAPVANGANFHAAADRYYDDIFDVSSWSDLIAQLTSYVETHGRVDEIAIIDHGDVGWQQIGDEWITTVHFEDLAPFFDDGGTLRLYGCKVGQGENGLNYCNWAADDAGPEVRVLASNGSVNYLSDGQVEIPPPYEVLSFDGVDQGYHP